MDGEAFFTGRGRAGRGKAKNLGGGAGRSLNLRGGEHTVYIRVSQKNLKSEFWYTTYPTGSHRLD